MGWGGEPWGGREVVASGGGWRMIEGKMEGEEGTIKHFPTLLGSHCISHTFAMSVVPNPP